MFGILRKSLRTGVVTTNYPETPPELSSHARGRPEIDCEQRFLVELAVRLQTAIGNVPPAS